MDLAILLGLVFLSLGSGVSLILALSRECPASRGQASGL